MARIKFLLSILLFLSTHSVSAKPLYTDFSEMIKNSKYIFVGTYTSFSGKDIYGANGYHFAVNHNLKGNPGKEVDLGRSENGGFYGAIGNQYVVFVNGKGNFEWMGEFLSLKDIDENSVVSLSGFCDWNAHIVYPGNASLGQLNDYITTGSYSGAVGGYVHFFSSVTKKMEPSSIILQVDYTYNDSLTSKVNVNGISLNDFKGKPEFYLPSFWQKITVEFDRNLYRPLSFEARVENDQAKGRNWVVNFYVEMPEEITYEDFITYVGNSKLQPPIYNLMLTTADNNSFPIAWKLYDDTYITMNGKKIKCYGMELAPHRVIRFDPEPNQILFEMDSSTVPKSALGDLSLDHLIIRELLYGPITGTLKKDGKSVRATLTYESSSFEKK